MSELGKTFALLEGEHIIDHVDKAQTCVLDGDWRGAAIQAEHAYNQVASWLNSLRNVAQAHDQ